MSDQSANSLLKEAVKLIESGARELAESLRELTALAEHQFGSQYHYWVPHSSL